MVLKYEYVPLYGTAVQATGTAVRTRTMRRTRASKPYIVQLYPCLIPVHGELSKSECLSSPFGFSSHPARRGTRTGPVLRTNTSGATASLVTMAARAFALFSVAGLAAAVPTPGAQPEGTAPAATFCYTRDSPLQRCGSFTRPAIRAAIRAAPRVSRHCAELCVTITA